MSLDETLHHSPTVDLVPDGVRPENEQLSAAILDFLTTFAFVKPGAASTFQALPEGYPGLLVEMGWRSIAKGINEAVFHSNEESWFAVSLNGVPLSLPRYTLRVMRHCLFSDPAGNIHLFVETDHWKAIRSELEPNALFLDIGAATGAMSVPYALTANGPLKILAFEPSPRTRYQLEQTIARNNAVGIEVIGAALSDTTGQLEFFELPLESENLDTPWLSEGSRLATGESSISPGDIKIRVPVKTLDEVAREYDFAAYSKIVIKIDVEGFEENVLLGGMSVLGLYKPFLSIDIHFKPGTSNLTGPDVKRILAPFGYQIEEKGHVLLCRPVLPNAP